MERAPGAAGKYRTEWGTLPVFQMQGDIAERILALNPSKRRQVLEAIEKDLSATEKMSEIKATIGGPSARAAVDEVRQHIAEFRDAISEVKRLTQLHDIHGAYIRKTGGKSITEEVLDRIPSPAVRGLKKLQAEMTPEGVESKALAIDELRKRIASRRDMRSAGKFQDASKLNAEALKAAGKKVVQAGKETLLEAAGGTVAAGGAVGLASLAAETQAIREIDQHGKDTTERSMLALANPEAEVMQLPNMAERFQGDFPSLVEAYQSRMGDLRKLADDPQEFVGRVTEAFEPLANAGHPEVAAKLITRMQIGIRYLIENAPPTLGTSMFEPEGSPPDEIAVLQFAPIWEAVWHPLDTVRDVATRNATPKAIKALREVHPDVYRRLLTETFRTLAQNGVQPAILEPPGASSDGQQAANPQPRRRIRRGPGAGDRPLL